MSQEIPLLDLQQQYRSVAAELEQSVLDVLRSGHYILGEHCSRLENEVAQISSCKYGVACADSH